MVSVLMVRWSHNVHTMEGAVTCKKREERYRMCRILCKVCTADRMVLQSEVEEHPLKEALVATMPGV